MTASLPSSHPVLDALDTQLRTCPVSKQKHSFRAPLPSDHRGVCPALNTMANHGYIPRNGKNLSFFTVLRGLVKCYGLSYPLALVLTTGGFLSIWKFKSIDLLEIGRHGRVEHDASLVHRDTPQGEKYGPTEIVPEWAEELVGDIEPKVSVTAKGGAVKLDELATVLVNEQDVARARVRREKLSPPLDPVHAEIARGEMAIILGVWETKAPLPSAYGTAPAATSPPSKSSPLTKTGIPITYLLNWLVHERLPDNWRPTRVQGLLDVMRRSKLIKNSTSAIRAQENAASKTK